MRNARDGERERENGISNERVSAFEVLLGIEMNAQKKII